MKKSKTIGTAKATSRQELQNQIELIETRRS